MCRVFMVAGWVPALEPKHVEVQEADWYADGRALGA